MNGNITIQKNHNTAETWKGEDSVTKSLVETFFFYYFLAFFFLRKKGKKVKKVQSKIINNHSIF